MYLGEIIENNKVDGVLIIGDFNANTNKDFFRELQRVCSGLELVVSGVQRLPDDTHTHLSHGSLTRSWLDHRLTSRRVNDIITNISIDNEYHGSDQFPFLVKIQPNALPKLKIHNNSYFNNIDWYFDDPAKIIIIIYLCFIHS